MPALFDQEIELRLNAIRHARNWLGASFDLSGFSYAELLAIADMPPAALNSDHASLTDDQRGLLRRLIGTMAEVSSADDRSEMAEYRIPRAGAARSPHYAANMGGRA